MAQSYKVGVIVGSLRKGSTTRMVAKSLASLAPASLNLEFVDIGSLTAYNQDLEEEPPAGWVDFRNRVRPLDAILFATPEYNRSVPGVLKNAIDIGSRPYGQSVWTGKPAAVVSVSPGSIGGFGANHHLRQSLVFLDMPVMQQPEAYIGGAAAILDESGIPKDEKTREFFSKIMSAFATWISRNEQANG